MTLKSWILDRMRPMNGIVSRADLPPRERAPAAAREPFAGPAQRADKGGQRPSSEPTLSAAEHLGVYAPLIAAIRDELEHFVASHVRLHLAIAERDRFLLTAIEVNCPGAGARRELLRQFRREFKPEQVKRYLAREVIAGLANAAAIDLSQFAGLSDADAHVDAEDDGEYRELLAQLATPVHSAASRPYEVNLLGRWTEAEPNPSASAPIGGTPATPLAVQRCEFDIEDSDGRRRVVLQSVLPGRRYLIGKDEGCDIRVNGTYASRRHAEIWLESGAWWAIDADSTNGIRVDSRDGAQSVSGPATSASARHPIRLGDGARMVLSARAEGPASDYPWVAMRPAAQEAMRATPIAASGSSPKTPVTAILPAGREVGALKITALQAGGVRSLDLYPEALPVNIGRSRNQTLVVDRRHEGVSGHHLEIVGLDESGAQVVVHGDNGVLIEGVLHSSGARIRWKTGETMVLGASADDHPTCTLTLARGGRS